MTVREALPAEDHHSSRIYEFGRGWKTWWDFAFSMVWMVSLIVSVRAGNLLPVMAGLRVVLGLVYVFSVPGYWLQVSLFPRQRDINALDRVGISLGLSVAVIPLLALLLDRLPWGIRLWPALIGELGISLLFALIASWRRLRLEVGEAYFPVLHWQPKLWWRVQSGAGRGIFALFVMILLLTGLVSTWSFLVPASDSFMTEFFILGQGRLAENYPRSARIGEPLKVYLGVTNQERAAYTYRVEVWVNDTWNFDRRICVTKYGPFELLTGQTLQIPVRWQMPWAGQDMRVDFLLFSDSQQQEPYRALRLFLDVDQAMFNGPSP